MKIIEKQLYHIYNQGNNRGRIFFNRENQLYFLEKFRKYVLPHGQVLAYCLMPNHFHFLIYTNKYSVVEKRIGNLVVPALSNGFRLLLSTYSQAINKQENRTGSLFRQKTKAKLLEASESAYPFVCFHYIHQYPMASGLVKRMEEWEFSSFQDYLGIRNGTLCSQELAFGLLGVSKERFVEESYAVIHPEKLKNIF